MSRTYRKPDHLDIKGWLYPYDRARPFYADGVWNETSSRNFYKTSTNRGIRRKSKMNLKSDRYDDIVDKKNFKYLVRMIW